MSYAWFSVSIIAFTPDEVLQIVPSMPSVSRPPFLLLGDLQYLILDQLQRLGMARRAASDPVIASSRP